MKFQSLQETNALDNSQEKKNIELKVQSLSETIVKLQTIFQGLKVDFSQPINIWDKSRVMWENKCFRMIQKNMSWIPKEK